MLSPLQVILLWRSAKAFAGSSVFGVLVLSNLAISPEVLTIVSLLSGFATAVTVALIGARATMRQNREEQGDAQIDHWVVERLKSLERENDVLKAQLWQADKGGLDLSGGSSPPGSSPLPD